MPTQISPPTNTAAAASGVQTTTLTIVASDGFRSSLLPRPAFALPNSVGLPRSSSPYRSGCVNELRPCSTSAEMVWR